MKKISLKNLSMDEVLTKDELKKIVGGNGSDTCQDFNCVCYVWTEEGEVPVYYPFTACTFAEVIAMSEEMLNTCESFSGCYAA